MVFALSLSSSAQCPVILYHPLAPDTTGYAYINCFGPPYPTYLICDNADTTATEYGLAVGPHFVDEYDSAWVLIGHVPFQMEQLELDVWCQAALQLPDSFSLMGFSFLEYCNTQISNHPSCIPGPQSTYMDFVMDGSVVVYTAGPAFLCPGQYFNVTGFDYGHNYQVHVYGSCSLSEWSPVLVAFSAGTAQFNMNIVNLNGGTNNFGGGTGSIEVVDVQPGADSPLPPPLPLTGFFGLYEWPSQTDLGLWQWGSGAYWDNLLPGQYQVLFRPDSLCNPVDTIVTIDAATAIGDVAGSTTDHLHIWPQPVHDVLHWNGDGNGVVRVIDMNGRVVHYGPDIGWMEVADLSTGMYRLEVGDRWARFVKW